MPLCRKKIGLKGRRLRKIGNEIIFHLLWILLFVFPCNLFSEELVILHTNDTHSYLLPFDVPEFGKNLGGVARRYEFMKSMREKYPNLLILSGGDILQGTPIFAFFKGEVEFFAYSLCGYDAVTLGNHDLDPGLDKLLEELKTSKISLVCTNVLARDGRKLFQSHKFFSRGKIRIAVLGCLGKEAWEVISKNLTTDLKWVEPLQALPREISEIKGKFDVLVLLSHSGFEADMEMAEKIPEIDIIVGGHTNTFLESPGEVIRSPAVISGGGERKKKALVVQAYKWGLYAGVLKLNFDENALGSFTWKLQPIDESIQISDGSPVKALLEAYENKIRSVTQTEIGYLTESMLYNDELKHKGDLPLGRFVCEILNDRTQGDIAIVNSGGIKSHLASGPITVNDVFKALPFDNTIVTYKISGKSVMKMLEFIAQNYGNITGYQYGGISFNLHAKSKRISDVLVGGKPLIMEKDYKLTTISYLADGSQNGGVLFQDGREKADNGYFWRDIVIDFIRKKKIVRPPIAGLVKISDD